MKVTDEAVEAIANVVAHGADLCSTPRAIAERVAALPHLSQGAVRVKPIDWRNGCASTPIGDYLVVEEDWDDEPFWFIIFNSKPLNKLGEHRDEASAIAAAQADYERRIMSALASHEPAPEPAKDGPEVVATAWTYIGQRHVDFRFEPDSRAIELGHLSDITPLVRLSDYEALRAERDAALEAEDEAKDCFWAIYPDWIEMKGHGISTEAARTALVKRAEAAEARNAELVKALERIERAIGAGISENGGEIHRVKISGKTRIEDGWLVGEFADQFREIMRTIQGIARAALKGQSNEA